MTAIETLTTYYNAIKSRDASEADLCKAEEALVMKAITDLGYNWNEIIMLKPIVASTDQGQHCTIVLYRGTDLVEIESPVISRTDSSSGAYKTSMERTAEILEMHYFKDSDQEVAITVENFQVTGSNNEKVFLESIYEPVNSGEVISLELDKKFEHILMEHCVHEAPTL